MLNISTSYPSLSYYEQSWLRCRKALKGASLSRIRGPNFLALYLILVASVPISTAPFLTSVANRDWLGPWNYGDSSKPRIEAAPGAVWYPWKVFPLIVQFKPPDGVDVGRF